MNSPTSPPLRARTGDPVVRVSRGLTLIEILIALGIVVALAALVLPTLSWMSRFRPLETACEDVEALCLRARAHAAVNGRPVLIELSGSHLEADWFQVETLSLDDSDGSGEIDVDESEQTFPLATWSRVGLQDGIRYQPRSGFLSEASDESSAWSGVESIVPAFDEAFDSTTNVLLAILLPDGTAISREQLVLTDGTGRTRTIMIDELTGRVTITEPDTMSPGREEPPSESETTPSAEPVEPAGNDLVDTSTEVES